MARILPDTYDTFWLVWYIIPIKLILGVILVCYPDANVEEAGAVSPRVKPYPPVVEIVSGPSERKN